MKKLKLLGLLSVLVLVVMLSACGDDEGLFRTGSAVFLNTDYVDYRPDNSDAEASNVVATLDAQGEKIKPFTGITADAISRALQGKVYLVIPEQENGAIVLDADAQARVKAFVKGGGKIIFFANYNLGVLNDTFGFELETSADDIGTSDLDTAAAAHTAFAAGPATIDGNNAVAAVVTSSLPADSKSIYTDGADDTTVAVIKYGLGSITLIGWDWFDAAPVGSQDGGWLSVLKEAYGKKP
jgi:hypothetical protein